MAANEIPTALDVIIIGGGITGIATAYDLALRTNGNLSICLIEKGDFAHGTTGRSHGLLHSGARYAVTDKQSAIECARENRILKRTVPHVIHDTGGLFIGITQTDHEYKSKFLAACKSCNIPAEELDTREALALEPNLNSEIIDVIRVPDACIDPFALVLTLASASAKLGVVIKLYTEVLSLHKADDKIMYMTIRDNCTGSVEKLTADIIVNATGPYVNNILFSIDCKVPLAPDKGTLIVASRRLCNHILNRLRPPGDGDIIVPHHTTSILGTTSMKITATEDGEGLLNETLLENHLEIHEHELRTIIYETSKLVPAITTVRLLRAYAGVRPLLPADNKSRRKEPRSFRIIDHGIEHDIDNLITVYGGKLTTYRLMAELTADLVCKKLGINACSTTAKVELAPTGANINIEKISRDLRVSPIVIKRLISKHGTEIANNIVITMRAYQGRRNNTLIDKQTICTCELVLRGEITYVLDKMEKVSADNIFDVLMRRTRLGMGLCQGAFCTYKLASLLGSGDVTEVTARIHRAIIAFLRRRWNGVKPVIRGEQLRQERLLEAIYACAGNYDKLRV